MRCLCLLLWCTVASGLIFHQECCQRGEQLIDSLVEREATLNATSIATLDQNNCTLTDIGDASEVDAQGECKLFHEMCCRRRIQHHYCTLGKKRSLISSENCLTQTSSSYLTKLSSACCVLCRSLSASNRSIDSCSSKSRSDYLRRFGVDFGDCCPVISGSLKILTRNSPDIITTRHEEIDGHRSSNYTCSQDGSLDCTCLPGFKQQGNQCTDINECQLGLASCPLDHRCDNTHGSYLCVRQTTCGTGYTWNHDLKECEDNDECSEPVNPCPLGTLCRNIRGSFRCDDDYNETSSTLNDRRLIVKVKCPPGYQRTSRSYTSTNCVDIDECSTRQYACPPGTYCKNVIGSYLCEKECPPGLTSNSLGDCVDIDECAIENACKSNSKCINTVGSYQCECNSGFTESSNACIDIDECQQKDVCPGDLMCTNTPGSFICSCPDGYSETPSDRWSTRGSNKCSDIDECTVSNSCEEGYMCINTPGSFKCVSIDCKLLGTSFALDPGNRNRCKRQLTCPTSYGGIKSTPVNRVSGSQRSFCREELHAFTFLSLPSNASFVGDSSRLELLAIRTTSSARCTLTTSKISTGEGNNLHLPVAISTEEPLTLNDKEYFTLIHQPSQSIVRVNLIKAIIGPDTLSLRVTCTSNSHKIVRAVTDIIITVSAYTF